MIKNLFTIAAMALVGLTASAQSQYHFTPHIGIGYTNMSNNEVPVASIDDKISNGIGLLAGAEFEYMVADKVGISAGVDFLYSKTDEVKWEIGERSTAEMHFSYSYLNMPVLVQYHMGKVAVKAGVQPTLCLSADFHNDKNKSSLKDGMNTFSLALPVGVSYEFNTPVVLDLRCAIPLTKQNKNKLPGGDFLFTSVMLTAGYRF